MYSAQVADRSAHDGVAKVHKHDFYLGWNDFSFNPLGHSTFLAGC